MGQLELGNSQLCFMFLPLIICMLFQCFDMSGAGFLKQPQTSAEVFLGSSGCSVCHSTLNAWAAAQREEAVPFFLCCLVEPEKGKKRKEDKRSLPFEREDQSLKMLQLLISHLNPEILLTLVGVLRA